MWRSGVATGWLQPLKCSFRTQNHKFQASRPYHKSLKCSCSRSRSSVGEAWTLCGGDMPLGYKFCPNLFNGGIHEYRAPAKQGLLRWPCLLPSDRAILVLWQNLESIAEFRWWNPGARGATGARYLSGAWRIYTRLRLLAGRVASQGQWWGLHNRARPYTAVRDYVRTSHITVYLQRLFWTKIIVDRLSGKKQYSYGLICSQAQLPKQNFHDNVHGCRFV